jgi:hypothetical protein
MAGPWYEHQRPGNLSDVKVWEAQRTVARSDRPGTARSLLKWGGGAGAPFHAGMTPMHGAGLPAQTAVRYFIAIDRPPELDDVLQVKLKGR